MSPEGTSWGCRRLGVRYGATVALEEVSFEVAAGTVAAVVGGDGAGKTSLLRALAGTVRPAAGTVRRPDERRLGYVSAGPGVWTDLTVDENLSFSGRAYGLSAGELDRRVGALLERTGLAGARDRLAGSALGRHAPEAGPGHGRRPRAGPPDPGRADHWGRPGEPGRAVAAAGRLGRRRRGRGRGHHLPRRGRAGSHRAGPGPRPQPARRHPRRGRGRHPRPGRGRGRPAPTASPPGAGVPAGGPGRPTARPRRAPAWPPSTWRTR